MQIDTGAYIVPSPAHSTCGERARRRDGTLGSVSLFEDRAAADDRQLAAADAEISRLSDEEQQCHEAVERALRQVRHSRQAHTTHIA